MWAYDILDSFIGLSPPKTVSFGKMGVVFTVACDRRKCNKFWKCFLTPGIIDIIQTVYINANLTEYQDTYIKMRLIYYILHLYKNLFEYTVN